MIDLHLHTTASDGRSTPGQLLRRAAELGLTVVAVTDHDTMAGVPPARAAAEAAGLALVPGIEITSVLDGRDIHVLGYWIDDASPVLEALLRRQRAERVARARAIAARLERAGAPIDVEPLLASAAARGGSVARPQLAAALVEAGHAAGVADAFDRFLSEGRPAYLPHQGPDPAEVVAVIVEAGGLASLAHPGTAGRDDIIPDLVAAGLGALEAYHSAHDEGQQRHYLELAARYRLAVSGGSDYHGEGVRRAECLGRVTLPPHEFSRLQTAAAGVRV